jgi:hypothetical protein
MSGKQDFLAALQGNQPQSAVPIWELEFHAWNSFSGQRVVLGEEFAHLSADEQERALQINAEVFLQVSHELHFAALTLPGGYWEIAPGTPAYYWLPEAARLRQIAIIQALHPVNLALVANTGGVMAMPGAAEYVQFCLDLYDNPQKIEQRARQTLANGLKQARRMQDLGIDAVFTASDIADNHGVFFKPALLRRFILPFLQEWASAVRELGLYAILHSDGNLNSCLEQIADSGVHALQAIDPVAGMDMAESKSRIGDRLTLCGNIDCGLLLTASLERVFESTRNLLETCKPGGRLVLGASNAVQSEVPAENYRAMVAAWEKFGNY